ncbi:MAG: isopentenyl-diphosphate delta-isomerase [Thermomicrobiales bacterium]|nr:MAG: isopentenyl-diphosphate delta-isomerase [Thermomicrobiales bacterium]
MIGRKAAVPSPGEIPLAASTTRRKQDHLTINLEQDVSARELTTGFERLRFVHVALPELDYDAIDLRTEFLGKPLNVPILISSMTGGTEQGWIIIRRLAKAAQAIGCAMGVGSQRIAIEDPAAARWFELRDVAPSIPLYANLGAVQLNYGFGRDECQRAVDMIEADALILHLNPLQEALQPEGNRNFSSLLNKIERICAELPVPVIVKEVGNGISAGVARQLASAGVAAIDVSGAGGTSWSAVEHHRAPNGVLRRLSESFIDWGIPTVQSIRLARQGAPRLPLIASGGLRTGIDAAKAIALGADLAGFAGPLLRAAAASEDAVLDAMRVLIEELRVTLFCTGCGTLADLRAASLVDGDGAVFERETRQSPVACASGWDPGNGYDDPLA